jgi:hypothetical protein
MFLEYMSKNGFKQKRRDLRGISQHFYYFIDKFEDSRIVSLVTLTYNSPFSMSISLLETFDNSCGIIPVSGRILKMVAYLGGADDISFSICSLDGILGIYLSKDYKGVFHDNPRCK